MSDPSADRDPVDKLAEEFAQRLRRGEQPTVEEYIARHPEWAVQIRELFPTLRMMEQLKPPLANSTAPNTQQATQLLAPLISERLGEYRILREIGRGGMGVVYEAIQESLGRRVALKVLPVQGGGNSTYLERFRREAKAAARLQHPNIIAVYGTSESNGVHYYAMQFIQGQGLDLILADLRCLRNPSERPTVVPAESIAHTLCTRALKRQAETPTPSDGAGAPPTISFSSPVPVPFPRKASHDGPLVHGDYYRNIAAIGLQVAEALAYAHQEGVLHRDIKPSNLILDSKGTAWVADFGLAKAEGTEELTGTGDIVGTLRFMAPERFDGESLPQSDLYSLGLTLYELLTLKPAFDDTAKTRLIDRILHETPTAPRQIDPSIPRDLETIVLKCIAKEPLQRYRTANDLADDLRRYLADQPIKARRQTWRESVWRWVRRNPAVAGLAAMVLLLIVVLAVQLTGKPSRPGEPGMNADKPLTDPGSLTGFRHLTGESRYFRVVATPFGNLWGTLTYTDDSSLGVAILHAGLLQPGEEGIVKVTFLPGENAYRGSFRNGVQSGDWLAYPAGYRVELVRKTGSGHPLRPEVYPDPGTLIGFRNQIGRTFLFDVVGSVDGYVWGTDIYTYDSRLATASVHAGVLRSGERGVIRVTILPGQESYRGSVRNGVTSGNYKQWDYSYRVEREER